MSTQKEKKSSQTGQNESNIKQSGSLKGLENNNASTLEARPIDETPFVAVKNNGKIYLTIDGAVATEKTWRTYKRCTRWVKKRIPVIQVTYTTTNVINKKMQERNGEK